MFCLLKHVKNSNLRFCLHGELGRFTRFDG